MTNVALFSFWAQAAFARDDSWSNRDALPEDTPGKVPSFLNCDDHHEWAAFRALLSDKNTLFDSTLANELRVSADALVANFRSQFIEFHESKSNDFFHACAMQNSSSVLCYYGSLAAYVTQYRFYRGAALMIGTDHDLYNVTAQLMDDASTVVRFMLIMKNNCLDFLDSSSWGIRLLNLVEETRKAHELRVEDEHMGDQPPLERNVLLLGRDAVGNGFSSIRVPVAKLI